MTRLLVFLFMVAGFVAVLNLSSFKGEAVLSARFNFNEAKKYHDDSVAEIAALNAPKAKDKKVEAVVKVTGIPLDTEELKNGHKLYKKCIACHGKMGEGKKSQKAPKVAGQYLWYLKKQINDMKKKIRVNKAMDPFIKKLSVEEIADLSLYMSKLPW